MNFHVTRLITKLKDLCPTVSQHIHSTSAKKGNRMIFWLVFVIVLIPALMLLLFTARIKSDSSSVLPTGTKAPYFSLYDQQGNLFSLTSLKGRKVALMFYPKPNTPGCTTEVCSIRDKFSKLHEAGITVLGVSKGSQKEMNRFKEEQHLSFPLLVADDEMLKKYHTKGNIFSFFLPKRHTFLINEQGIIVAVITKVEVEDHAEQILREFKKHTRLH